MKLIIAGSRNYNNYNFIKESVQNIMRESYNSGIALQIESIVSGGANGVDKLGEQFAKEFNIPCIVFPANWSKHGKAAGPIRNKEMAEFADTLIAFPDMKSIGTINMITTMKNLNKKVYVVEIKDVK